MLTKNGQRVTVVRKLESGRTKDKSCQSLTNGESTYAAIEATLQVLPDTFGAHDSRHLPLAVML